MKLFVSAGEASGDALGAALIRALRERVDDLEVFGMGGSAMRAEGLLVLRRAEEVNVVGLFEVLRHLWRLYQLMWDLSRRAIEHRPDVAVLIDIPDFNLRLAKRFARAGIPVAMYVGPSVWAWRPGRVHVFKRWIKKMMVLFPFEISVWAEAGVDVVCVGHPLLDEIPSQLADMNVNARQVALLPGSRRSEIDRHLGVLLECAEILRKRGLADRFVIPVAPTLDRRWLEGRVALFPVKDHVELREGDAATRRAAVSESRLALVASGTATLETALLGRPQVIFYRTNWLSHLIGRRLMKVAYFGLPNLIAGGGVAPELLQDAANASALARHAEDLLLDTNSLENARKHARLLRDRMAGAGAAAPAAPAAAAVAAESVLELFRHARRITDRT